MTTTTTTAASTRSTSRVVRARCIKCSGARRFEKFAHIANGDCFACGGSGLIDARLWGKGLRTFDEGSAGTAVSFVLTNEGHELGITGGRFGGIVEMARPFALELIKASLDHARTSPRSSLVEVALRLAALNDARAEARAVAYLGERGEELASALAGATVAIAEARRLAAS